MPSANGPQLGYWRVAVVRVEETRAGDASGPECPRAEPNRQQPIDLPEVAGNVRPALLAGGSPRAGLVNSVGPVRPSSYVEKTLEPFEHMVHTLLAQLARMLQGALSAQMFIIQIRIR